MNTIKTFLIAFLLSAVSAFAQAPNEEAPHDMHASHKHHKHHHRGGYHHGSDSMHTARLSKAFFDYVKEVKEDKKSIVANAFINYTKDARTHSPTKKIRNQSKAELDTQMKQLLDNTQFQQYQDFIKDFEKMKKHKGMHHGGKHGKKHCDKR